MKLIFLHILSFSVGHLLKLHAKSYSFGFGLQELHTCTCIINWQFDNTNPIDILSFYPTIDLLLSRGKTKPLHFLHFISNRKALYKRHDHTQSFHRQCLRFMSCLLCCCLFRVFLRTTGNLLYNQYMSENKTKHSTILVNLRSIKEKHWLCISFLKIAFLYWKKKSRYWNSNY